MRGFQFDLVGLSGAKKAPCGAACDDGVVVAIEAGLKDVFAGWSEIRK